MCHYPLVWPWQVEQPFEEWSKKYARCGKGLPPDKVALYGRQIIEVRHSFCNKKKKLIIIFQKK